MRVSIVVGKVVIHISLREIIENFSESTIDNP